MYLLGLFVCVQDVIFHLKNPSFMFFFSFVPGISEANQILNRADVEYPDSALFLYFRSRVFILEVGRTFEIFLIFFVVHYFVIEIKLNVVYFHSFF